MAAALHLKLLGGFDARRPDGAPLAVAGKKNQALLAYLALCRGQLQTREKIVGQLWSDRDDEHARNSLRQALVALRRDLDSASSALVVAGDRLALDPELVDVDALAVEHLTSSLRADDLRTIVRLYRGDLLDGFAIADQAFEDWLAGERARLRELVITAALSGLPELAGEEAVAVAQRALALDPLREASHRALMRAFAGHGHPDLALRQYQTCRDLLRKELGIEPDAETTALREEIVGAIRSRPSPPPRAMATAELAPKPVTRRLAAILAADVAGYSRLMGADEEGTLKTLNLYRGVITQLIEEHEGRIVGTAGDNVLAEFASAVQAVRAAVAVQRALNRRNADLDETRRMHFRIGINLGDVMVQGADLLGDGVNVAARLEQMAEPRGILVSGMVWEQIQGKLAFPCEYLGEQTAKNIARPVRTYRVDWKQPDMRDAGLGGLPEAPDLPSKPSIVILPFANIGGDPEQEYFADGISEEIITALSKSRWLFVIARNTSFAYKGKTPDIKQVGRELGVRYVLEGSVRKAGNRVRITAQLIEAATGTHLWSERYDRDLADTFDVQDEITESVVGAIEPELQQVERQRAARKSPENMDAWDHYMRGLWWNYQFNAEGSRRAEHLMRRAIEIDPTLALGHMGLARVLVVKIWWGWSEDPEADGQTAYAAARRAIELDDRDPYTHYTSTWPSLIRREHENALAEAQKAIDLAPNFALAYLVLGAIRLFLGRFDQVADPIQRAMRLSPHEPLTWVCYYILALGQYHQGQYDEAAKLARMGIGVRPFHMLYRVLAACYGQLDRAPETLAVLAELRRLRPNNAEQLWDLINPYVDPAHRAHLLEGLRKAELLEAAAVPTKPSIAVLPFANMSGDPAQQYFSDGITEDIITELSRFRSLFVIARNSAFQYRDQAVDVRRVARELGVQYVVEGSVRIAGERLRITAQLIEAGTGNHLWAERYDRDAGDVLTVQAETAQAIAAVAGARTDHAERSRAMRLDPSNLRAYHHHLRGRELLHRYRREDNQQAQIELETAIRLDPTLAEAYADLSNVHVNNRMLGWVADRAGSLARGFALAQRSVGLDERSSRCRRALALAHLFRREHDDAGLQLETGMEINPNDSRVRAIYGFYLSAVGQHDEALRQFDIVAAHDPRDEMWIPWVRGIALFTAQRYEAAIRSLKQVANPNTEVRGWLVASLAMDGRTVEAKAMLDDLLRLAESDMAVFPGRRLRDWEEYWHGAIEYRDQKDFDHLFAALRKAGMAE